MGDQLVSEREGLGGSVDHSNLCFPDYICTMVVHTPELMGLELKVRLVGVPVG